AGADTAQPGGGQADPRILCATDPVVFPPQTTTAPAGAVVVAWFGLSVFDGTHRGGVEAAVDVENFATDARGQVGAEEGTGVADFLDGHVAAQRGLLLVGGEHLAEALDAGRCQGTDRPGRNGIHASTFRT